VGFDEKSPTSRRATEDGRTSTENIPKGGEGRANSCKKEGGFAFVCEKRIFLFENKRGQVCLGGKKALSEKKKKKKGATLI